MNSLTAPVTYRPAFIADSDGLFETLWHGLDWRKMPDAPRLEYFCSLVGESYTYGRGRGQRTYHPQTWTPELTDVKRAVEAKLDTVFEVLFLNGYENERNQLGWHADDSPEMDDDRPIAVVSLGAAREILFKPQGSGPEAVEHLMLEPGSLCVMAPGMQDTHWHRIPKVGHPCGPRISLTFRGYKRP